MRTKGNISGLVAAAFRPWRNAVHAAFSLNLFVFLLLSPLSYAQDIHFSQFYETSILRNPALTGVFSDDYKIGVAYRNQWSSISNPYQTGLLSMEGRTPIKSGNGNDYASFGLLAYYDKAGSIDYQTMSVYPAINYNKSLGDKNNSYISVGFTGGYTQNSFNPNKATFNNQYINNAYSPLNPTGENITNSKLYYWDVGAGVNYNASSGKDENTTYMVGVSGYHFSTPVTSFMNDKSIKLPMRWNINASLANKINESYSFQVHLNYAQQGVYSEMIGGALLGWAKAATTNANESGAAAFFIYIGAFYRVNDAVIPTVKIKYKDYSFGLSYDVNVSKLKTASQLRGGLELTVFKTGLLTPPDNRGKTLCPSNFF
jgi:type IX secretion system PorP/SprF family membrane protein